MQHQASGRAPDSLDAERRCRDVERNRRSMLGFGRYSVSDDDFGRGAGLGDTDPIRRVASVSPRLAPRQKSAPGRPNIARIRCLGGHARRKFRRNEVWPGHGRYPHRLPIHMCCSPPNRPCSLPRANHAHLRKAKGTQQTTTRPRQPILGRLGLTPHDQCQSRCMRTARRTTTRSHDWLPMRARCSRSPIFVRRPCRMAARAAATTKFRAPRQRHPH